MTRSTERRRLLAAGATLAAAALVPPFARAQAWPAKPIRIVCAFAPGGLTDLLARAYGDQLSQRFGQPVVVENRAGAGGMIGGSEVAKSAPDGYTLLFTISTTMYQNRVLYKKMLYDPDRDFTLIAGFHSGHLPLSVNSALPVKNAREFLELAKRERVTLGNYSPGSFPHMVAQQLNKIHGTKIEAVAYKGETPMYADLVSGQIQAGIGSVQGVLAHAQSGRVRIIAVPTSVRSPRLPDVPTFAEQGLRDAIFDLEGWLGMLGPAGMPRDIVQRLGQAVREGAETPRIRTLYENSGLPHRLWIGEEFEKLNREIGPQWVGMARELGVTLE
jgi:tripartite-type tricarboxylate transporter receptor subunit TctC